MTDPNEKGNLSNGFHTPHPTIQLNDRSLPGTPDFLEMELQYVPVSDSPTPTVHATELSPNKNSRRKSSFSSVVSIPPYAPRPPNHLCIAIFGLLCCVFPFGLIGLLCSLQVDSTYDDGDSKSAEWKSSQAKVYSLAAIVIGMLGFLAGSFYVIFYLLVPSVT